MMPDNWSFVAAAYGLAALVLGGYWRFLLRRGRELDRLATSPRPRGGQRASAEGPAAGRSRAPAR
jgi:hypothetical protein